MSANLSHAAQGFVNCVVVGKDIVPRLSVVNIGRLIDELVFTPSPAPSTLPGPGRPPEGNPFSA